MRTKVVRIGNSQGVRIPKPILEQVDIGEEVEMEVQDGQIVIRPAGKARQGWEEAFRAMAEHGDDQLLDEEAAAQAKFDEEEWEWE